MSLENTDKVHGRYLTILQDKDGNYIDAVRVNEYNALITSSITGRIVTWGTDSNFNAGTFTDTEVSGTDEDATVIVGIPDSYFCGADYNTDINLTATDGSPTGTAYGGASVSAGELDLAHDDLRYVEYSATDNLGVQKGALRCKYTPNYSGTPVTTQYLLATAVTRGSLVNTIEFRHNSNGELFYIYFNSSAVTIASKGYSWSPVAGTQYEIEYNWDFDTGIQNLIIDGVVVKSTPSTGTRTDTTTLLSVGTGRGVGPTETSNFKLDDLIIFNDVQHTANYTPGYSVDKYNGSGTWESNEYDSTYLSLDWGAVNYSLTTPSGTTAAVKVRAGNESGNLGDYGSVLSTGDESNVTGRYLQFKVEYTSNGTETPSLDSISCTFSLPLSVEVSGG